MNGLPTIAARIPKEHILVILMLISFYALVQKIKLSCEYYSFF